MLQLQFCLFQLPMLNSMGIVNPICECDSYQIVGFRDEKRLSGEMLNLVCWIMEQSVGT